MVVKHRMSQLIYGAVTFAPVSFSQVLPLKKLVKTHVWIVHGSNYIKCVCIFKIFKNFILKECHNIAICQTL